VRSRESAGSAASSCSNQLVHLHDHVGRLGGASLQRLDEGPHRQQALAALGALVDDRGDALVDRPRNVEIHLAESGGQHAAEHGDVELGGVGEMLEHGARRDARHLGDVAHDGRHLSGERQGKGRADNGFARSGDAIAAGGSLQLLRRVGEGFDIHYTDSGSRPTMGRFATHDRARTLGGPAQCGGR
jgi:hypothetical protein